MWLLSDVATYLLERLAGITGKRGGMGKTGHCGRRQLASPGRYGLCCPRFVNCGINKAVGGSIDDNDDIDEVDGCKTSSSLQYTCSRCWWEFPLRRHCGVVNWNPDAGLSFGAIELKFTVWSKP